MRSKLLMAVLLVVLCFSLFGQTAKTRAEFFNEFYGTLINSSGLEIPKYEQKVAPTVDLSDVIKQLESRYNIDIPAEKESEFKTVEEVAEYVNLFLQQQSEEVEPVVEPLDEPVVKPVKPPKEKKKSYSWKYKFYGSYGLVEPDGVTGDHGWDGNLFGAEAFNLNGDMYTWEAGIMLHPYGWTGKEGQRPNSFGFAFDYSKYKLWGSDTTWAAFPDDTTAFRYGFNLTFHQNLTGRKKDRPKMGFYVEESIRFGVISYGHYNSELWDNNHLTYGVGFAQGLYFLIFDLKFYQTIAYSPDILVIRPDLSIMDSFDIEIGLRLGIALKF